MEKELFNIYPIRQQKLTGQEDYRFACFLPTDNESERFQILNIDNREAYLVTTKSDNPKRPQILSLQFKNRKFSNIKTLEGKSDLSHFCMGIYGEDYSLVNRVLEIARKEGTTQLLFGLISRIVKIGLKIVYNREKNIQCNELVFFSTQLEKYLTLNKYLYHYYLDLQNRIFADNEDDEIHFVTLFLNVGLNMQNHIPIEIHYFEN